MPIPSLLSIALATADLAGLRHPTARRAQRPIMSRQVRAPRLSGAAPISPRKQAAGDAVIAAFGRLQAAKARTGKARRAHLDASMARLVNRGRSSQRAHDLRLAQKGAKGAAEVALAALQAAQADFDAAVRKFYRAP